MSAKFDRYLSKLVEKQSGESSGSGSVAWGNITGKPSTFTPSDHVHEISDVTGLQSALDAKGTVKTVNGVTPDGSGNVTIETGSGTVDLGSYTGKVNITATANATIRAGSSGNYSLTLGSSGHGLTVGAMPNSPTVDLSAYGSTGTVNLNGAKINIGGSSGSTSLTLKSSSVSVLSPTGAGNLTINVGSSGIINITGGQIAFNGHSPNTAGGLPLIGENGFLPESIIPQTSSDTEGAVRRYPATVDAETGVVSVTDGTPVADVRIGDEIVTPEGVYKKTTDSITSGGDPATGDIQVSGISMAAIANGVYKYQSENKWKHESQNYYMVLFNNTYWVCGSQENPTSYNMGIIYSDPMTELVMPWEVEHWTVMGPASTIVVESLAGQQTVTNTIDLFGYASLPSASESSVAFYDADTGKWSAIPLADLKAKLEALT